MLVDTFEKKRDIVLELRPDASNTAKNPLGLQSIDITHQFYLALSYPLMFIRGEPGWSVGLKIGSAADVGPVVAQNPWVESNAALSSARADAAPLIDNLLSVVADLTENRLSIEANILVLEQSVHFSKKKKKLKVDKRQNLRQSTNIAASPTPFAFAQKDKI